METRTNLVAFDMELTQTLDEYARLERILRDYPRRTAKGQILVAWFKKMGGIERLKTEIEAMKLKVEALPPPPPKKPRGRQRKNHS